MKITYLVQDFTVMNYVGMHGFMMSCVANSAKKMTSVKSMHYIGLEFIKPIWEPKENAAAAWLVVF